MGIRKVSHAEALRTQRGTSPQLKELNHEFHGWAAMETNANTGPISISRVEGGCDSTINQPISPLNDPCLSVSSVVLIFLVDLRRKDATQTFVRR